MLLPWPLTPDGDSFPSSVPDDPARMLDEQIEKRVDTHHDCDCGGRKLADSMLSTRGMLVA